MLASLYCVSDKSYHPHLSENNTTIQNVSIDVGNFIKMKSGINAEKLQCIPY